MHSGKALFPALLRLRKKDSREFWASLVYKDTNCILGQPELHRESWQVKTKINKYLEEAIRP